MANPLQRSVDSAIRANDEIKKSFARFGTSEHPRGFVVAQYRSGLRAMRQALKEPDALGAAMDVMAGLKAGLSGSIRSELVDMTAFGFEEAARQLSFYGVNAIEPSPLIFNERIDAATAAALAKVEAQEAMVKALILTGADAAQIMGDDERAGVVRVGEVLSAATYWAAALVWEAFSWLAPRQSGGLDFQKQAIAALDGRTTDCCLRVHAQIQPLNGRFRLTGTPRFADQMDWSPFHNRCRTAIALYLSSFDMGLTEKMQAGANAIMAERAAGKSGDRHPADAYG